MAAAGAVVEILRALFKHCIVPRALLGIIVTAVCMCVMNGRKATADVHSQLQTQLNR
jgi:hypothetical protein